MSNRFNTILPGPKVRKGHVSLARVLPYIHAHRPARRMGKGVTRLLLVGAAAGASAVLFGLSQTI